MKQPLKAVDALLAAVEKQFGKGAMMRLGDGKLGCDLDVAGHDLLFGRQFL